jgi:hypothetical protein
MRILPLAALPVSAQGNGTALGKEFWARQGNWQRCRCRPQQTAHRVLIQSCGKFYQASLLCSGQTTSWGDGSAHKI